MDNKRFTLKMSAIAVLCTLSGANVWAYTQGDSEFATIEKGDAVRKINNVTAENPDKVTGEMNRSGNPVRIIWYGNPNDNDGKIPQKGAKNAGFIYGEVNAQGQDSASKTEYQSSIQVEGQGNAIDALGWTAPTNPNDVIYSLERVQNSGVAQGVANLNGGLGSVHGRVETYGSGNGISIVGTADFGKQSSVSGGVDGVSGASSVSRSSSSASVAEETNYVAPNDLRGNGSTSTTPPAYDSTELINANMYGKTIQIALSAIQNSGKLQGSLQAKANQEINNPVTDKYYPQFFGVTASAAGNGVSVSSFINTPDKYTYSEDKFNTARLGDVKNSGNILGEAVLVGGKNTTHTQTLARGAGNGISVFAATGNFAKNQTSATLGNVNNTGRIEGAVIQTSGNNSGYASPHMLSTAQAYGSGNGVSTFTETLNAQTKSADTRIGSIDNTGRITGFASLRAGNGTGDLSVTARSAGNGVAINIYGNGRTSSIGNIANKGIVSGELYTKAGVINNSAKTGKTIADEEAQVVVLRMANQTDKNTTSVLPKQSENAARLGFGQGVQTGAYSANTDVHAAGNGISAYGDNRDSAQGGLGDVNNQGVISGYAKMYHGIAPSNNNVYQSVGYLGVGSGVFADRNISSNITNLGIISGNHVAMLAKGNIDTSQSVFKPVYNSGFTGTVTNYGLMSGILIAGNYRSSKNSDEREPAYSYFETDKDPIQNHGTYIYLASKAKEKNPWLASSSSTDAKPYGSVDRIVVAPNSTQIINGISYDIINAPLTANKQDSEYRTAESALNQKIINGAGLANGALIANGNLALSDSIVNGYGTALKLEDGANVSLGSSTLNANGFKVLNGNQETYAIKGSNGANNVALSGASFVNGNIHLFAGDDVLTLSGADAKVNGRTVDLGEGNDTLAFEAGTESQPVKVNYAIRNAENIKVKNGVVEATSDARIRGLNTLNLAENSKFILKVEDVLPESADDLNADGKTVLTETTETDAQGNVILAEKTEEVAKRHALYDNSRTGEFSVTGKGTFVVDTAKAVDRIDFGNNFNIVKSDESKATSPNAKLVQFESASVMQDVEVDNGDLVIRMKKPVAVKQAEEQAKREEDAKKAAEAAAKEAEKKAAEAQAAKEAAEKAAAELAAKQAAEKATEDAKQKAIQDAADKIAAEKIAEANKQAEQKIAEAEAAKRQAELALAEAERARQAAEKATADKAAEADAAKRQVELALAEAERARQAAEKATADKAAEADAAKRQAELALAETERARQAAEKATADKAAEADAAKRQAELALAEAERARQAAEKATADKAAEADAAKRQAELALAEAERARQAAEKATADKAAEADAAKRQAELALAEAERVKQAAEKATSANTATKNSAEEAKRQAQLALAEAERAKQALEQAKAEQAKKEAELAQIKQNTSTQFATPYVEAYNSLIAQAEQTNVNPLKTSSSLADKTKANQAVNAYLENVVEHNIYAAVPSVLLDSAVRHREITLAHRNKMLKEGEVYVAATGAAQQSRFEQVAEKAKSNSAVLIMSYGFTDNTTAGISLAQGHEDITGKNASQLKGNSHYASGYISHNFANSLNFTSGIAYQQASLKGTRVASNGMDTHSFDVKFKPSVWSVYSQVKMALLLGETMRFEPKLGVAYNRLSLGNVEEKGVGALSLENRHYQTVDFSVGQDLVLETALGAGKLAAKAGVDYVYTPGVEQIHARFNGGNGFDVNTENNRSAFRTNLSAEYTLPNRIAFKVGASNTFRKSGNLSNVNVGVGYTF